MTGPARATLSCVWRRQGMVMSTAAGNDWGRIDDDGAVYVRTSDGERQIGSWHAGSPEDGLAYYTRGYDDLKVSLDLLAARLANGRANPADVVTATTRIRDSLALAPVIGDLDALARSADEILASAAERAEQVKAERAEQAQAALAAKEALVVEAEELATSSAWKVAGERLKAIGDSWRDVRVDRKADQVLWKRFAAARDEFNRRRATHFAERDRARKTIVARKEELIARAEELASSTEWGATAAAYRELMTEWKAAGHTGRSADDALWERFRQAQNRFFEARSAALSERDEKTREVLATRAELVAEAEAIDISADLTAAQKAFRDIRDRYDHAGRVGRGAGSDLDRRMAAVDERLRAAANEKWLDAQVATSPFVARLRESIDKLEARLTRAERDGDTKLAAQTREALETQRQWLAQARVQDAPRR